MFIVDFCFCHNFQKIQNSRQQPMSLFSSRFAIKEAQISYSEKCMICFPVAIGQFLIAIRYIFQAIRQVLVAIGQVCEAFRQVYKAIRQVFRAIRQVHVAVRQIVQLFIRWLYFSDMFLQLCFRFGSLDQISHWELLYSCLVVSIDII